MNVKVSISFVFAYSIIFFCTGLIVGMQMNEKNPQDVKQFDKVSLIQTPENVIIHDQTAEVSSVKAEVITADTKYIMYEKDLTTGKVSKTEKKIPAKYIGMSREQLIEHLSDYVTNPPLYELEKGFVNMEILSFSPNQVQIQSNYQYVSPTESFYIVAYNHKLMVTLDDKETIYLSTQIDLMDIPFELQKDVLMGLFIPNEEALYDFLETYTS